MAATSDDAEISRLLVRVLNAFDLGEYARDGRWMAHVRDLRRIVAADYCSTVKSHRTAGMFPVRSFVSDAQREFPEFNVQPIRFDVGLRRRISALGINLQMQPYLRRRPLRGFYHRDPDHGPLIWVNLAHPPGAVAASLGHELGHWYRERLLGCASDSTSVPFFNGNFVGHLKRPDELFADVFPVLAAYPTSIAAEIFPAGGWRSVARRALRLDGATLRRLRTHLAANYGFDALPRTEGAVSRRIYYVTSMVHFARLRWALLAEFDL